ncbi:hypothetical protein DdX_15278 [Ditylenchus destructor]|uniref:Uncharacterized protein n=1 Tax=Ditylenchus destructor TaxID=166010 RepID=A0AAD4MQR5_9BILA|nr:hypothetical protein DdX_15278 [Ditylenchus destructor]
MVVCDIVGLIVSFIVDGPLTFSGYSVVNPNSTPFPQLLVVQYRLGKTYPMATSLSPVGGLVCPRSSYTDLRSGSGSVHSGAYSGSEYSRRNTRYRRRFFHKVSFR